MSFAFQPLDEHAVYARKRNNRKLVSFLPEKVERENKNIFVNALVNIGWMSSKVDDKLNFTEALLKAEELYNSGDWYKVYVLQSNYDKDGYNDLCALCVWENGICCEKPVRSNTIYNLEGKTI